MKDREEKLSGPWVLGESRGLAPEQEMRPALQFGKQTIISMSTLPIPNSHYEFDFK